jgi:RNA 2',3'-cyclic 3'-phosphodiesterase
MRLFVGLPLASEVLHELSEAVVRLKTPEDSMRWTAPESWHITLQFLGNTDQKRCDCVLARLEEITATPFPVQIGKLGFFERAGVFLVDVLPTPELIALAQRVVAATNRCGFVAEDRPYHPHITLARAKAEGRGGALRALLERLRQGGTGMKVAEDSAIVGQKSRTLGTSISPVEQPRFTGFTATEFLLCESFTRPEGAKYEVRGRFRLGSTI